ncbi:hypothetical protein OUZ56_014919 [Daphnia magna]|uniref:Uncharacterized protein n=1 Tax=Daphnia magna TaxID=35525 RepID=A0ABR0AL94_9CRUS|nr:hypothetical protein OUZ56_014919 [Daphnia magna]
MLFKFTESQILGKSDSTKALVMTILPVLSGVLVMRRESAIDYAKFVYCDENFNTKLAAHHFIETVQD